MNDALAKDGYVTECFEHGVLQIGLAAEGEVCFDLLKFTDHGKNIAATIGGYPNMMFNVYPWGVSVNIVVPTSVETTQVLFRSYVKRADLLNQGAGAEAWSGTARPICGNRTKGMRSSAYEQGVIAHPRARCSPLHRMITSLK